MIEISKIIFFLLRLISSDLCCFDNWSPWQESSLTCGQVCKQRKRDIVEGLVALQADTCHYVPSTCPWSELEDDCVNIDCRELNLRNCSHIKFCHKILSQIFV